MAMKSSNLVRAVYDNGGRTFDRYTIFFYGEPDAALTVGPTGNVPNGVFIWSEAVEGEHLGKRITIRDLPSKVIRDINEFVQRYE